MKAICRFVMLLLGSAVALSQGLPGFTGEFVVPFASSNLDGNTLAGYIPAPHEPDTSRFQQVYGASEFAYLTNFGGGWLYSNVRLRGDATNGAFLGIYMPSVQVNLSTTTRGPDELSATFSENVGTNETRILEGQLITGLQGGRRPGPEPFSFVIPISGPMYFYNPAKGNLLLDIRVFRGNTNPSVNIPTIFDAVSNRNDSVSRVYSGDVNATTGMVDTVGLPTQFICFANPKPSILLETNSVVIKWPVILHFPLQTLLETTKALSSEGPWQTISNGIVRTGGIATYVAPLESNATPTYYRLLSTSP